MATKRPLCNYSGSIEELHSGDTLPGGGGGGISSVTWETQNIDMQSSDYLTVIDDDFADILLSTVTSEPAAPQWTKTIVSGNIPADPHGLVNDWVAIVAIGGRNLMAASSPTVRCQFTLNGVNVGSNTATSISANNYWHCMFAFAGAPLAAGDVLGAKVWQNLGSPGSNIDIRYATIYILPRTWVEGIYQLSTTTATTGIVGAISGVTYASTTLSRRLTNTTHGTALTLSVGANVAVLPNILAVDLSYVVLTAMQDVTTPQLRSCQVQRYWTYANLLVS